MSDSDSDDSREEIVFSPRASAAATDDAAGSASADAAAAHLIHEFTAASAAAAAAVSQPFQVTAEQVESVYNTLNKGVKASLLLVALDAAMTTVTGNTRAELIIITIKAIISLLANTVLAGRTIVNAGVNTIDSAIQFTADAVRDGFLALAWGLGEIVSVWNSPSVQEPALTALTGASLYSLFDRFRNGIIFEDIANMINRGAIVMHEVGTESGPTHSINAVDAFGGMNDQPSAYRGVEDIMIRDPTHVITLNEYRDRGFKDQDKNYRSVLFNLSCYSQEAASCSSCDYAFETHRQLLRIDDTQLNDQSRTILRQLLDSESITDVILSQPTTTSEFKTCKVARHGTAKDVYSASLPGGGRRTKKRKAYKKRTHKRKHRKTHKKLLKRKRRRTRK